MCVCRLAWNLSKPPIFDLAGLVILARRQPLRSANGWTDLYHICDLKRRQLVDTTETGGMIGPFVREQAGTR
jgi:hypothetical protein